MKHNKKNRTIFYIICIPLIIMMFIQSCIAIGTLVVKKTSRKLNDYAVNTLTRTVENRKIILENDMTRRWSLIYNYEGSMLDQVTSFAESKNIEIDELFLDSQLKGELLDSLFSKSISILESNSTTGIYFIFTDDDYSKEGDYQGFYIRDSDILSSSDNNSDLLLERGNKELSRKYNVSLDSYWTTHFKMSGAGNCQADDFFYEPWIAGENFPNSSVKDLGKWSLPFSLGSNSGDSYEMITYSIPLRYNEKVYAVMGIEVSESVLYDYLPVTELNDEMHSGYVLALDNGDGTYTTFGGKGVLYDRVTKSGNIIKLSETEYGSLYKVSNLKMNKRPIYAVNCPLNLYDKKVPYDDTKWCLIALNTEKDLFGMSKELYMSMLLAVFVALSFGIVGIYVLVKYLTSPLKRLVESISQGMDGLQNYKRSKIIEVEAIYDVVDEMINKQKEIENVLIEEKELYMMVLETTNDLFFSYDFKNKTLEIVNHNPDDVRYYEYWNKNVGFLNLDFIYFEDRDCVKKLWDDVEDEATVEFRVKMADRDEYQWFLVHGSIVCDTEGERSKVVGCFRNIQKQKIIEEKNEIRSITDKVTGLYTYEAGMKMLDAARRNVDTGVVCYFHMRNLNEINENNTLTFGDMILESIGEIIIRTIKDKDIAFRLSGAQIVVWLNGYNKTDGTKFVQSVFRSIDGMFNKEIFKLSICAGIASNEKGDDNSDIICKAKLAENFTYKNMIKDIVCYDELSNEEQLNIKSISLQGRQEATDLFSDDVSLVSVVLSLFSKGENIAAQMKLVLKKVAESYGVDDVYITINRSDFNSSYLEYQWHRNIEDITSIVKVYNGRELKKYIEWIGDCEIQSYSKEDSKTDEIRKFVNMPEGSEGVVLPLYDSNAYMGVLCLQGLDASVVEDIEERQNLLEIASVIQGHINQKNHDLASRAKSDFLSRMSHEIRTPMNGIIGMTTIALNNKNDKDRVIDCLNKIKGSSEYLLELINDVLDVSRIESGKMSLEAVDFNIKETLDNVIEMIAPLAEKKNINFTHNITLEHFNYNADKVRIGQILINLLENAVKFTPEHGNVELIVNEYQEDESSRVLFAVKDTGKGIDEKDKNKIFKSFEQLENTARTKLQGAGLGLSISRQLVRMMGGDIELDSEVGKGSMFSFDLALPVVDNVENGSLEEEYSFDGYKVLVVEDNELNAEIAVSILEDGGFEVDCVYNGKEAVDQISQNPPGKYDVILMDIMMPVMDGLDATRAIRQMEREDCQTLPIVAMSANAFDDDLKKSVDCGMNGHLSKPVDADKLFKKLAEVIFNSTL